MFFYALIIIIFGSSSKGKNLDNYNVLVIFIFFVPYALSKLGIAISKYIKYYNSYNPVFLTSFYTDVVLTFFTITNVVIMFGLTLHNQAFMLAAQVLVIALTIFCITVSIYQITIGIGGLMDKRKKSYQKYLRTTEEVQTALEEDE